MALTQDKLHNAEYVRNIFCVTPEMGVELKDMLKPDFWAHVAAKFRPSSRIEVLSEDSTWFAELLITSCGRNWASVSVLRFVELAEAATPAPREEEYEFQWKGQNKLHCVIRKADHAIVKDGFPTKAEAVKWLQGYQTAQLV